jgi:hypothetical protein
MRQRAGQRGLTIIGFLLVAGVVAIFVVVGARTVPAYIEWYSIQKAVEKSLREAKDPSVVTDVRKAFDKFIATDYIESVQANELDLTRQGNEITATVAWTRKLPLVANVSLYLEFEASATR